MTKKILLLDQPVRKMTMPFQTGFTSHLTSSSVQELCEEPWWFFSPLPLKGDALISKWLLGLRTLGGEWAMHKVFEGGKEGFHLFFALAAGSRVPQLPMSSRTFRKTYKPSG
ncbi:MAG: hypothetical protein GY737_31610 [Desulfobacteraceae bacterium]|nr:hypothetical protein [Desulfobacteraceae bacterium]